MIAMDTITQKIDLLPPFPETLTRLMKAMRDEDVTAEKIADIAKFDQGLTANIIRYSNSSYFGLRRTIKTLRDAVVYIGIDEVKKIIIRSNTQRYFENQRPGYETGQGELWGHVIAVSIIGENINIWGDLGEKDSVFTTALLHDIGKLVLSEFVFEAFNEIIRLVDTGGITFLDAEEKVLGLGHAEVGGMVLERWGFDSDIIEAVKKHHQPVEDGDPVLANVVRLSDNIALMMGYGTAVDGLAYQGFSDICTLYDISQDDIQKIMSMSLEEIANVTSEFGFSKEES